MYCVTSEPVGLAEGISESVTTMHVLDDSWGLEWWCGDVQEVSYVAHAFVCTFALALHQHSLDPPLAGVTLDVARGAITPPGPPSRTAHGDDPLHSARTEGHDTTGRVHDARGMGTQHARQRGGRGGCARYSDEGPRLGESAAVGPRPGACTPRSGPRPEEHAAAGPRPGAYATTALCLAISGIRLLHL